MREIAGTDRPIQESTPGPPTRIISKVGSARSDPSRGRVQMTVDDRPPYFKVAEYSTRSRSSRGERTGPIFGIADRGGERSSISAADTVTRWPAAVSTTTRPSASDLSVPATIRPSWRARETVPKSGAIFASGSIRDWSRCSRSARDATFERSGPAVPPESPTLWHRRHSARAWPTKREPPRVRVAPFEAGPEGRERVRRRPGGLQPPERLPEFGGPACGRGLDEVQLKRRRDRPGREPAHPFRQQGVGPGGPHPSQGGHRALALLDGGRRFLQDRPDQLHRPGRVDVREDLADLRTKAGIAPFEGRPEGDLEARLLATGEQAERGQADRGFARRVGDAGEEEVRVGLRVEPRDEVDHPGLERPRGPGQEAPERLLDHVTHDSSGRVGGAGARSRSRGLAPGDLPNRRAPRGLPRASAKDVPDRRRRRPGPAPARPSRFGNWH